MDVLVFPIDMGGLRVTCANVFGHDAIFCAEERRTEIAGCVVYHFFCDNVTAWTRVGAERDSRMVNYSPLGTNGGAACRLKHRVIKV